jgi:hypothetical protein
MAQQDNPNNVTTRRLTALLGAGATMVAVTAFSLSQAATAKRAPATDVAPLAVPVLAGPGSTPSISGDGRYLVYAAPPAADDGRSSSIWYRDLVSGTAVELTTPGTGIRAGESVTPVISADGCSATFVTEMALDIFYDDDSGTRWDVYNTRLPHCDDVAAAGGVYTPTWIVVSERNGDAANDALPGDAPAVSGTGDVIAYTHSFSATEPDLSGVSITDLTVAPGVLGRNLKVYGTPAEAPDTTYRYRGLRQPSISDDGSIVAYVADAAADAPTPAWGTGPEEGGEATSRVFVWDRNAPGVPPSGVTGEGVPSGAPSLSASGDLLTFTSPGRDLVPSVRSVTCDVECADQVYVLRRTANTVSLISGLPAVDDEPAKAGDGASFDPTISADGSTIVFVSHARNLFTTQPHGVGGPQQGEIVAADVTSGTLRRLSVSADGVSPASASNAAPAISSSARVIVFDSGNPAEYTTSAPSFQGRAVVSITQPVAMALADLDLGTVGVNAMSPEWFVSLVNRGNTSFLPATIDVDSAQFTISAGTTCAVGVPVLPGRSCRIAVTLIPTREGPITAQVRVAEEGHLAAVVTSSLRASGGIPALDSVGGGGRWTPTIVGQNGGQKTFTVNNVSLLPLTASKVEVLGDHPQDFTLVGENCTTRAFSAGAGCAFEVVFTPTAAGLRTASVRVSTAEGLYTTVLLDGEAFYSASIATSEPAVQLGSTLTLTGGGFAANVPVTIVWADGSGTSYTTTTSGYGTIQLDIEIARSERTGTRQLVAQAGAGGSATITVDVMPLPRRINPAVLPRRP